jgi:hypothetical protein
MVFVLFQNYKCQRYIFCKPVVIGFPGGILLQLQTGLTGLLHDPVFFGQPAGIERSDMDWYLDKKPTLTLAAVKRGQSD